MTKRMRILFPALLSILFFLQGCAPAALPETGDWKLESASIIENGQVIMAEGENLPTGCRLEDLCHLLFSRYCGKGHLYPRTDDSGNPTGVPLFRCFRRHWHLWHPNLRR